MQKLLKNNQSNINQNKRTHKQIEKDYHHKKVTQIQAQERQEQKDSFDQKLA